MREAPDKSDLWSVMPVHTENEYVMIKSIPE